MKYVSMANGCRLEDELVLKLYNLWSLNLYLQMYHKSLFISSQVKVRKEFWNVAVELSCLAGILFALVLVDNPPPKGGDVDGSRLAR